MTICAAAAAFAALILCVSALSGSAAALGSTWATRDRGVQSTVMLIPTGADGKTMTSCAFEISGLPTSPWVGRAEDDQDIKGKPERIGECQALVKTGAAPATNSLSGNVAPAPSDGAASAAALDSGSVAARS